jgi:acyl-CoA reductase-like NAD-dependent aldehyde dehydrogenase
VNPATEAIWARVPDGSAADIDAAVTAARAAFPAWRTTSPGDRAAALRALAGEIEARSGEFTRLTTAENGTPVTESSAAAPHAAAHLRHVAGLAGLLEAHDARANPMALGHSIVQRVPLGVAGLITPWNFPLGIIILKLAPALLAGCTTVIKPAPEAPMAARLLMEAVAAAGLPPGVVNLVTGTDDAGTALVSRRDFALSLGATDAVAPDEFTAGYHDLDVVIDAVGHPPQCCPPGGPCAAAAPSPSSGPAARARWSRFPPTSSSTTTSG